jgi:Cupin-like domain
MAHKIREWRDVTPQRFEADIRPIAEPAVLRGFVQDWPIVSAARRGDLALVEYLKGVASPGPVPVNVGPPEIEGRLHYKDDMRVLISIES